MLKQRCKTYQTGIKAENESDKARVVENYLLMKNNKNGFIFAFV